MVEDGKAGRKSFWYYKRDIDMMLDAMRGLSLEECGALNILVDLFCSREGRHLYDPRDRHIICTYLGIRSERWERVRDGLAAMEKLRLEPDGKLVIPLGERAWAGIKRDLKPRSNPIQTSFELVDEKSNDFNGPSHIVIDRVIEEKKERESSSLRSPLFPQAKKVGIRGRRKPTPSKIHLPSGA
jgi:hypothetical protein